jgi:large subunit ribosomal protein L10
MAAEMHRTARVPDWKVEEVAELVELISKSRVLGIVGMREIPASDLQQMRQELRGQAEVRVVRNNILRRALDSSSPELRPLADFIDDQTALIFSQENPFKLYSLLEKGKRPMPIRAGAHSPKDIAIEAGETSFSPGPMVGKLQAAGIPAAIKGGKVVITQRTVLAREGEVVSHRTADILKVLEIYPKNVGLDLRAAYDGGLIFRAKDLVVDVGSMLSEMGAASARAFGLAVEVGYATPETVGLLLQRAQARARSLVAEAGLAVPGAVDLVLFRAVANARAIARVAEGGASHAAPAQPSEKEGKAKEEEKKEEEDAAAGLSSLFD